MREAVQKRKIELLYHFTKIQNLGSIMELGIIPRAILDKTQINYKFNDELRIDGQLSASCLSIEHPNYKMFYWLRQQDKSQEWVVLGVNSSVLWEKDCAFCCENAASAEVIKTPIHQRKGKVAFEKIFDPISGKPTREDLKIPSKFPTNPQAEVLVFEKIEPKFLSLILTETIELKEKLSAQYTNVRVVRHSPAFSPRIDFAAWK